MADVLSPAEARAIIHARNLRHPLGSSIPLDAVVKNSYWWDTFRVVHQVLIENPSDEELLAREATAREAAYADIARRNAEASSTRTYNLTGTRPSAADAAAKAARTAALLESLKL